MVKFDVVTKKGTLLRPMWGKKRVKGSNYSKKVSNFPADKGIASL
jgi:aminoglycoside N3'-acetyltransferase